MAELEASSAGSGQGGMARSVGLLSLPVIVAALGYFVDIYDLLLFGIIRKPSLAALGVPAGQVLDVGAHLLNMQMIGMLMGGILWGVLGDRRGRLSVLFGSIILYSLANIANGLVQTVDQYAWMRLFAGVGLAGELGAGITLVSESIDKERRGLATTIVAGVGICGALVAVAVSKLATWKVAFFIGGGLGLALLALRIGVLESGMFERLARKKVSRGNFFALFTSGRRLKRYLSVILCGVPIWYLIGVVVIFSPELGAALGMKPAPVAANAIFWSYFGLVLGDFGSGWISQWLRSRKRALRVFIAAEALTVAVLFAVGVRSASLYYACCVLAGFAAGYWAVFVTVAAEQFGTNLRATAATTVPNFVRGMVPLMTTSFTALGHRVGLPLSAMVVGGVTMAIAFVATFGLEETFGKDLDYVEE
jgi:putative MFS transporter